MRLIFTFLTVNPHNPWAWCMNEGLLHSHFAYCSYCPDDPSQYPAIALSTLCWLAYRCNCRALRRVPCAIVRWSRERLRSMVEEHTALMHRLMHEELPPQRYATPFDTPKFMKPYSNSRSRRVHFIPTLSSSDDIQLPLKLNPLSRYFPSFFLARLAPIKEKPPFFFLLPKRYFV
jgi:hypothetical protein